MVYGKIFVFFFFRLSTTTTHNLTCKFTANNILTGISALVLVLYSDISIKSNDNKINTHNTTKAERSSFENQK